MVYVQKISPCLWFDHQAEFAAQYYTGIFPNSRIVSVSRFPDAGQEIHGKPVGSVMSVNFTLDDQSFVALNGGPVFHFNEALSLQIHCHDQADVDYYWDRLGAGGDERAQQCGWLKDRFGLSWQVVPTVLPALLQHPDPAKARSVMQAMLQMKKMDIEGLRRAAE